MSNAPPKIDSFAELSEDLAGGDFNARASKLMRELALAVEENGGVGKMTITIAVARSKEGIVQLKPTIKVTKPEPGFDSTSLYLDGDGRLSRENPRQERLPKVPMTPGKLVKMDGGAKDAPAKEPDKDPNKDGN